MDITAVQGHIDPVVAILRDRFRVARLDVFGSVARHEAGPDSDVDFIVTFAGPYNYLQFLDLADFLEECLGRPVDLTTSAAMNPSFARRVARESVHVT